MKRRFAAIFALVLTANAAHADAPAKPLADALSADARSKYDEGRARFKDGDYAAALAAFDDAHAQSKEPRLLWNMAACERKLGRNGRALLLLQDYLLSAASLLTKKEEQEAKDSVAAIRALVAQVTIRTQPAGVEVSVDGVKLGTTPLSQRVYLDQGTHAIRYEKGGFVSLDRSEELRGGTDVVWSIALEPVKPAPEAPPKATPAPIAPPKLEVRAPASPPSRALPWIVTGAGAFLLVGGTLGASFSYAHYKDLERSCSPGCDPSRWDTARTIFVGSEIAVGVGAAAMIGGLIWALAIPDARPVGRTSIGEVRF